MIEVLDYAISKGYWADESGAIFGPRGNRLKEATGKNGYKFFGVRKPISSDGTFNVSSHRFVAYYFLGEVVNQAEVVRHLDGDKLNNRLDNLKPGSVSDNFGDNEPTWRKNFALAGAAGKRKLSAVEVRAIRKMLAEGISHAKTSSAFNVSKGCVQQIKEGKSYAWVK